MDQQLIPKQFDADPTCADSELRWKHWKRTFDNFISEIQGVTEQRKLQLMFKFVSANVYSHLSERLHMGSASFKDAVETLDSLYLSKRNEPPVAVDEHRAFSLLQAASAYRPGKYFFCGNDSYQGRTVKKFRAGRFRSKAAHHTTPPIIRRAFDIENCKELKCIWVNSQLKEQQLLLYCKNGVVADLLEEAKKQVELSENGSGKLRLLVTADYKIHAMHPENRLLVSFTNSLSRSLRIEEIPNEEIKVAPDELLIPVGHFQEEALSTFGVPFLLKIKHKEPFLKVKERIQKKLQVPDKEFEQYKFAIVALGLQRGIIDEMNYYVNLRDFRPPPRQPSIYDGCLQLRPWLGLNHTNRVQKRLRLD